MDELRRKGLEKMNEVYGWEMPDMPGDYFALTADHLFGTIWTRPGLSMRDKRMMTLTCVTALGISELAEIQVNAALSNEEFTVDELKEMAIFLTHYLGFPLGSKFDGVVTKVAGQRKKAAERGAAEDKKGAATAALQTPSGRPPEHKYARRAAAPATRHAGARVAVDRAAHRPVRNGALHQRLGSRRDAADRHR